MKSELIAVVLVLVALALVGLIGYLAGHGRATTACERAARAEQQTRQGAIDAAVNQARADGDTAIARLATELQRSQQHQATLTERRRHVPLALACRPPPAAAATGADGVALAAVSAPATAATEDAAAQPAPHVAAQLDPGGGPELTAAAVGLWNSALAGADVPAGTCLAADPAEPACVAGSGLHLADAWDNQAANAASCAADRRRLAELIGLLCTRPGQPGCSRPQE